MSSAVVLTGLNGKGLKAELTKLFKAGKPDSVGIAVAYVSVSGFDVVKNIFDKTGVKSVRLIADIHDAVTHPEALKKAMDAGWSVGVVETLSGTFHSKLIVGGLKFDNGKGIDSICLAIAGSANLSHNAFFRNAECIFYSIGLNRRKSAALAWKECWDAAEPLSDAMLANYEQIFAERNRKRSPLDIITLGVADNFPKVKGQEAKKDKTKKSPGKSVSERAAMIAWAGLESFTGEYKLQVEFPKEAGLVLKRLFSGLSDGEPLDLLCSDKETRSFSYRYYEQNGMFRLNVPNDAPRADWARNNKSGAALVKAHGNGGKLSFEIMKPGEALDEIMERSIGLGTWGKTRTRLFGWY